MAEKKKVNVKVLNKKHLQRVDEGGIRVIVKGGQALMFKIRSPLIDKKKLVVYNGNALVMVTSRRKLAADIENYLKKQGMEPIAIYPVYQHSLV
jgi:hypothetical protein